MNKKNREEVEGVHDNAGAFIERQKQIVNG